MSDSGSAGVMITNSTSNLIEIQHVGVSAQMQSPLKNLLQTSSSSTETESGHQLYSVPPASNTKYNKLANETQPETETASDNSKVLYEMRTVRHCCAASTKRAGGATVTTPSKIEFQLYNKHVKRARHSRHHARTASASASAPAKPCKRRLLDMDERAQRRDKEPAMETSLFKRLRRSLQGMRMPLEEKRAKSMFYEGLRKAPTTPTAMGGAGAPPGTTTGTSTETPASLHQANICIYPFEHGCADYLRTTDCPPHVVSLAIAERATHYATLFWAEFFGSLHIGVIFVVTFFLQSYRFVLYSLVNTLVCGFLHMTSDYLIKPLLTVLFNGFLQPPLILTYNVFASLRDILEPVADTVNNFMRPLATVGRSIRLVHATSSKRQFIKDV